MSTRATQCDRILTLLQEQVGCWVPAFERPPPRSFAGAHGILGRVVLVGRVTKNTPLPPRARRRPTWSGLGAGNRLFEFG